MGATHLDKSSTGRFWWLVQPKMSSSTHSYHSRRDSPRFELSLVYVQVVSIDASERLELDSVGAESRY